MTGPRGVTTAVAAALLLVLGGCTGSSTDADPAPSAATTTSTAGAPAAESADGLDARLAAVRDHAEHGLGAGVPAVLVLVVDGNDERVVTVGRAVRRPPVAVTPLQRFRVASLTKTMVATVVLRLVEDGRLTLDATVEELLPGLLAYGDEITVEQLLSHYAGLPEVAEPIIGRRPVPDRAVARQVSAAGLDSEPGTLPYYRNSGYLVLGLIVEEITGRPLADVLDQLVFTPARMPSAALSPGLGGPGTVHGYAGGRDVTGLLVIKAAAAGGVVANARDVDRFAEALFAGDLVSPATLEQMMTPHGMRLGPWSDYGLGLAMLDTSCGTAYGHSGRFAGYASEMWVIPELARRVVAMVNSEDIAAEGTVTEVRDAALCGSIRR